MIQKNHVSACHCRVVCCNLDPLLALNHCQEALDVVHVSKDDQENAFAMLAAVLWLGNVSFTIIDNENHVEPVADEGKLTFLQC